MKQPFNHIHLTEINSTNDYIKPIAEQLDDNELCIVSADYQTKGRGNAGNHWESEKGKNLLFSLAIKPLGFPASKQFNLSMAGALALKDVVSSISNDISLKWPNDIYWKDRKLAGTLIETTIKGKYLSTIIWGVGLNVNQETFTSDAPNPVSLLNITGKEFSTESLLQKIAERFQVRYNQALLGEKEIREEYMDSLYRKKGIYTFLDSKGEFNASVEGISEHGHLILRDKEDNLREYDFKEVKYII